MIQAIFGLPRQGKTTVLTKIAQKNLAGKTYFGIRPHARVFTNFECLGCYQLDFDTLGVYRYEDSLILIDEIMLLADTRDFKTFPKPLKYFFSHHGHFNIDIVWCSQYWDDCDKKIRVLTDRYYLMEAHGSFTVIKPIQRYLGAEGGHMVDTYRTGAPITWRLVYRPRYYRYFDSFTQRKLPPLPDLRLWDWDADPPAPDLLSVDECTK